MEPKLIAVLALILLANAGPQAFRVLADRLGIKSTLDEGRPFSVGLFVLVAMLMGMAVGIPIGYAIGHP